MGEPNNSQRVSQHGSHTELRSANRNRTHGISPVGHLRHYLSHLSRDFDGPRETNHQMASLPLTFEYSDPKNILLRFGLKRSISNKLKKKYCNTFDEKLSFSIPRRRKADSKLSSRNLTLS